MTRILRIGAVMLIGVLLLCGATIVGLQLAISRGVLTPQLDSALERATGRRITYRAISMGLGLWPRIELVDTTIANFPGGSHAEFARIGRFEVTLALLPLVVGRVEIDGLTIADAEITLERNALGQGNWVFGAGGGESSGTLTIEWVEIENSRIRMAAGPITDIRIDTLSITRDAPEDPVELDGRIRLDGEAVAFTVKLGRETDGVLPLEAAISGEGFSGEVEGSLPRSIGEPAWSLRVRAEADSAALQRLATRVGRQMPPLGDTTLSARLGPGEPWPTMSDVTLSIGAMDLAAVISGVRLARAELRLDTPDSPVTVSAQGWRGAADLGLHAQLPSLNQLAREQAFPIQVAATSGRARLDLSGSVPRDLDLPRAVFDARLTTPDLAALSPVIGLDLPPISGVAARARLRGLTSPELRFDGVTVTADALEAAGDVVLMQAPRPAINGQISARRLDLDVLAGGAQRGGPRRGSARRVISDIPIPFEALRRFDASLRVTAAHVTAGGAAWRDVSGTIALREGRLTIDPLAVTTPGGAVGGRLQVDASATPPRVALRVASRGRGLDLGGLRSAFGVPAGFQGMAELALDLHGQGATTRNLAATLSGEAGIAMVGGRFTGATALRIGPDLVRALLPRGTPNGGVAMRCLAVRLSAHDGVVSSGALLLEGDFGRIDGSLFVNLRNETIAARLLPDVRLMGVTVRAPVTIGGTLSEPRMGVEPGAALTHVIGDTVANRLWRSSTVEFLRGVTGIAPSAGDCGPALTLARLGRAGPMPEPAATPIPLVPREIQGTAQEVFRGIGGLFGGGLR